MKYILGIIIFLISLLFFTLIEYGRFTLLIRELVQPLIFASVTSLVLKNKYRQHILYLGLILFSLMILFYLFDNLLGANWLGSSAMGILIILFFSYIPKFYKNGHI